MKRDLSDLCGGSVEDEESSHQHKEAQYLSANCVLLMSYSGDASSVVDEHFSRSLNQQQQQAAEADSSVASTSYADTHSSSKGVIINAKGNSPSQKMRALRSNYRCIHIHSVC